MLVPWRVTLLTTVRFCPLHCYLLRSDKVPIYTLSHHATIAECRGVDADTKFWRLKFQSNIYMDVSENRGTPKSSILIGFSIKKPSILGYPYFWKHPSLNLFQRLVHKETIFGKYVSSIKPCKSKKMSRNFIFSPKTC